MTEPKAEFEQLIEVARLALGRGDRTGAEGALTAAIELTDDLDDLYLERADALMRLGALKHETGNQAEGEELLREALNVSENALGADDVALIPALTSLGTVLVARGAPEEARPLLTRALGISESHFGADHPDLVVLLNELSRLYLKRSAFSFAEPLLTRLLAIKRAKGEEHPEVATVLASLGAVRQGLGDHDGAEQLFRRALKIREKTLAPNHFAIAATLEHLADICAARGKFSEALNLYQRALPMREMTLGVGHASMRVARERIADLQLQASEESFDAPMVRDTSSTPFVAQTLQPPPRLNPPRSIQRRTPAAGRMPTPAPVKERERMSVAPAQTIAALPTVIATIAPAAIQELERQAPLDVAELDDASRRRAAMIPWSDGLRSVEQGLKEIDKQETPSARAIAALTSANAVLDNRSVKTAVIVGGTALLLLAVFAARSQFGGTTDQRIFAQPAPSSAPVMAVVLLSADSTAPETRGPGVLDATTRTRTEPARTAPPPRSSVSDSREFVSAPKPAASKDRPMLAPRLAAPIVPNIALPGIDSVLRAATTPTKGLKDPFPVRMTGGIGTGRLTPSDDNESGRGSTLPKLLGAAPVPKYPDILRGRQLDGEVVVQFLVDDHGRAQESSMKVVRSPHDLLTNSVRAALSQFKFEPARTAAPQSKPRSEWVKFAFQFSSTK